LVGCDGANEHSARRGNDSAVAAARPSSSSPRVWVALINGGGSAERNYQSHLLHVRELVDLLGARGVERRRMAVFASDGDDPTPDLAVLDRRDDGAFWLVDGLSVGEALRPEIHLVDSSVDGIDLYEASRARFNLWIAKISERMRTGDTLLIYVTDHGWKNGANLDENAIVMWGEHLHVSEMRAALRALPDGVRVVMLMSQCFSGSFANLIYGPGGVNDVDGSVCGYFSTTAERFAYGCYAENRGRDNVGHSFRFIEGLRSSRSFLDAHATVLLDDRTPDVPHRTSDHYLRRLLLAEAQARGVALDVFVDELLEQAWSDELHYKTAFAEIDELGEVYGSSGPRTLVGLEEGARNLPSLRSDLDEYASYWRKSLHELRYESFSRFLAEHPDWQKVADVEFLEALGPERKRETLELLLDELADFTFADRGLKKRLRLLKVMAEEAQAASYRMAVRLGASLRMRVLLLRIAGQVFLDRFGDDEERAAFARLTDCEDFSLGERVRPLGRVRLEAAAYPPLTDEMELLAMVLPGWMGVEYRPLDAVRRAQYELSDGAVVVTGVYPHSPAERAGLQTGDVILGPPGAYFAETNQIREWVMTSIVDEVRTLHVLRDGRVQAFEFRIGAPPA
jgi:hypothetical protein